MHFFSDFRTLYDFADPNHLLPTGKSSGKSKYVVPKIQPVRRPSMLLLLHSCRFVLLRHRFWKKRQLRPPNGRNTTADGRGAA